jgi:hypothetical protein
MLTENISLRLDRKFVKFSYVFFLPDLLRVKADLVSVVDDEGSREHHGDHQNQLVVLGRNAEKVWGRKYEWIV